MTTISIPPQTQERLTQLVKDRDTIQLRIDEIVTVARDLLGVPDDYVLHDLRQGFVAPAVDTTSTSKA